MQKPILIFTGALILILSFLLCLQGLSAKRLKLENDALRRMENTKTAPVENLESPADSTAVQADLLRLRGEVARLHQTLIAAEAMIESLTNSVPGTNDSPVENFLINTHTNIGWGQSLVAGGWKLPADRRGLVFIQAGDGGDAQSIRLHVRLLEVPQQILSTVGLDEMKEDLRQSSVRRVISAVETERVIGTLTSAGAILRASTHYNQRSSNKQAAWGGNQVVLSLTTENNPESGARWLSPSAPVLIVTPTVSPDRQSLHLTVSGLINYPRNQTRE